MGGHNKGRCADILSEGEKVLVLFQVIDGLRLPLVDLDLLHAWIALDIDQVPNGPQIVVHVVRSADIERTVGLLVESPKFGQRQPGNLSRLLEACAIGPATLKPVFLG